MNQKKVFLTSYIFPSIIGHVDPGENESETALREVEEESGLTKNDLRIVLGFEKILNVYFLFSLFSCL